MEETRRVVRKEIEICKSLSSRRDLGRLSQHHGTIIRPGDLGKNNDRVPL